MTSGTNCRALSCRKISRKDSRSDPVFQTRIYPFGRLHGVLSDPGLAQATLTACESQQSLEQAVTSDGSIMPDDCRPISAARLTSDGRELCLIDLSQSDGGLIDSLQYVASPDQWWVACSELERLAAFLP